MPIELTREVVSYFRDASQSPSFDAGLKFMEQNWIPEPKREDEVEKQHYDTLLAMGYRKCLRDIRERLTEYPGTGSEDPSIPSLIRNP